MDSISFVTKYSNSFYKIELSKTLLHFIEYDFTYFCEQAIELGKKAKKTSEFPYEQATKLVAKITKCHPYFEALQNFEFDDIVSDCIIDYICKTEGVSVEELWGLCISPKNSYEKVIFSRISRYKTNSAINQWVNIMKIQQYARRKLAFIFEGEPCSVAECKARCKYFDLAFSVAVKEIGFPGEEVTAVQRFSVSQMPNSAFMISKPSKEIYKRLSPKLNDITPPKKIRTNDLVRDEQIMNAFDYIKEMSRPSNAEMLTAIESFRFLPDDVYLPNSFKAIIDLEFDKMLENDFMFVKCEKCGRYFHSESGYNGKLCNRIKSTGKSCREEAGIKAPPPREVLNELNKKSEDLYKELYKKVGRGIPKSEFNDWSEYMIRLKDNVEKQHATIDDLENFLTYTEKMYCEKKEI